MNIDGIISEINHMKKQVKRQRADILSLERAGIDTAAAEVLLGRMIAKLDGLQDQRERLSPDTRRPTGTHRRRLRIDPTIAHGSEPWTHA